MSENVQAGRAAGTLTASTGGDDIGAPDAGAAPGVADLQADIERTRRDLSRTVDQLAAKLDVKTRVRNRAAETRDDAARQLHTLRRRAAELGSNADARSLTVGAGVLAAATAVLLVTWWRRNQSSHTWRRR